MNARASFKQIGFGWWIACLLVAIFCTAVQGDQLIPLRETGPRDKRVNLLVLGDGYTAGQEAKFRTDAARFFDATLAGPYTIRSISMVMPPSLLQPRLGQRTKSLVRPKTRISNVNTSPTAGLEC
jgi:hypothetical protein